MAGGRFEDRGAAIGVDGCFFGWKDCISKCICHFEFVFNPGLCIFLLGRLGRVFSFRVVGIVMAFSHMIKLGGIDIT